MHPDASLLPRSVRRPFARPALPARSRLWPALGALVAALGLLVVAPAAVAQCVGKAYFPPVENQRVKLHSYTSQGSFDVEWTQETCVSIVNLDAAPVSGVQASFGFESSAGKYTIQSSSIQPLAGGAAAACIVSPSFGPDAMTVAEIVPTSPLAAGAHTNACCFVFEAQSPPDECESLPGEGDTVSGHLEVGPIDDAFSTEVRGVPQDAACGLVGPELLLPWLGVRRRRRSRGGPGSAAPGLAFWLAALAAGWVMTAGAPARAFDYALGASTDVDLSVDAISVGSAPLVLSGSQGVDLQLAGLQPTAIRFQGGTLTLQPVVVATAFGAISDVDVTLTLSTGRVTSDWIPLVPVGAGVSTFAATTTWLTLATGTITASGFVHGQTIGVNRPFDAFPLASPNLAPGQGSVSVTTLPNGQRQVVVALPVELLEPLSFDTGTAWLRVDDGLVELEATLPAPVPAVGALGTALLAGALGGAALLALSRPW